MQLILQINIQARNIREKKDLLKMSQHDKTQTFNAQIQGCRESHDIWLLNVC